MVDWLESLGPDRALAAASSSSSSLEDKSTTQPRSGGMQGREEVGELELEKRSALTLCGYKIYQIFCNIPSGVTVCSGE
jgi:hypothetical protein